MPAKNGESTTWTIDESASKIKFTIKNMGMTVDGEIGGLKGQISFDEKDLEHSKFDVEADVSTISTGIEKRNKDLMAEKYFYYDSFKYILFHSDSVMQKNNEFTVAGNFVMKGISQHRKIPFTFERNANGCTFKSSFIINRLDFGIGGKGPAMGTEVNVNVELLTNKK